MQCSATVYFVGLYIRHIFVACVVALPRALLRYRIHQSAIACILRFPMRLGPLDDLLEYVIFSDKFSSVYARDLNTCNFLFLGEG